MRRRMPMADESTPPSHPLSPASDRLRATVNWLIASLGAVAVAVIGGISLTSLGDVSPATDPAAFGWAVAGAGVAILAALGALITAASITARSTVTITDLTRLPARGWRGSVLIELAGQPGAAAWRAQNYSAAREAVRAYLDAAQDYDRAYLATVAPNPDVTITTAQLNRAGKRYTHLKGRVAQLMSAASYLRLRSAFRSSLILIACFMVFVIAGALTFAVAIATLKSTPPPASLTAATWSVPDPIRSIVADRLGAACDIDLDAVPVMIIDTGKDDTRRFVTIGHDGCAQLELSTTADRVVEE